MSNLISEGDKAPDFSMPTNGGQTAQLSDFTGKWLILYFYPKDSTPGCTTEGQDFTRLKEDFAGLNAEILGVSRDSLRKHENFIAKAELAIRLGSDEDGTVCEAYGVWVEKKNYGRTYMGIERSTYLIAPDGSVAKIWRKVRVKDHAEAVLNTINELRANR